MENKKLKIIYENLDRRFRSLVEVKDDGNFIILLLDYVFYLGNQEELSVFLRIY